MQVDSQNTIKGIAKIFKALSAKPDIAEDMVESIASMMYEPQADSIMNDLEESIDMSMVLADVDVTATVAYLNDGAFISLQDDLSYQDNMRDDAIASLIEYGIEPETAKEFHFQVLARCISYLNHSQNIKYHPGEVAERIWGDIQADSEENEEGIFFDKSAIASATAKELMSIFQDMLNSKGGILTHQALVNYVAHLIEDAE